MMIKQGAGKGCNAFRGGYLYILTLPLAMRRIDPGAPENKGAAGFGKRQRDYALTPDPRDGCGRSQHRG
jgi:hypothetical protein